MGIERVDYESDEAYEDALASHQADEIEQNEREMAEEQEAFETSVQHYVKKPIVVDAIKYDGNNRALIYEWSDRAVYCDLTKIHDTLFVSTLEGVMKAEVGDWIIKGIAGEFYPCKPEIFKQTYEGV